MSTRPVKGEESSPPVRLQVGGDAFPTDREGFLGLSALDYFAGQALVGVASYLRNDHVKTHVGDRTVAAISYDIAEKMLTERDKRRKV